MATLHRLSPEVYEKLESVLPKPVMSKDTTDQQTGYLLGIQYVLSVLREGFTVDTNQTPQRPLSARIR